MLCNMLELFFKISIFVTTNNIKSCRCIWFCSSVQTGAKKRKQVPSSTKLRLGETFVLQLMECLTPAFSFDIFMDNYFISFRLLEVNNIRATSILDKNSIHKCAVIWNKQLQEKKKRKKVATLNSTHQVKKQCKFD